MNAVRSTLLNKYLHFLDNHIQHILEQVQEEFLEINQIAEKLNISHSHLTDSIQKETGHHPCYFYDLKIIEAAKELLLNEQFSIAEVARRLTYDPSNFSKFFKKFTGITPGEFRKNCHK